MDLTTAELSSIGPVRSNNEDFILVWEPPEPDEKRARGAVAILADGVGGHGHGEVASRLAAEAALWRFQEIEEGTAPRQTLRQMFTAANLAVYDQGMADREDGRMATTLTISLFRNDEVTIGHMGDCRVYLIQGGRIRQITADHSYAAMQVKLGLLSPQEAAASELRSVLTRSVGKEPVIQADYCTLAVNQGDLVVQCSDGLHQCVTEEEICEIATHAQPREACQELVALAEKRGTEDNLPVQIVQIGRIEQLMFYRGLPIYHEPEPRMSHELEVGQTLDERFQITEVLSRSGMATIFKAKDLESGQDVAVEIPFLQFESDPAFYSRFQREEEIGKRLDHPYILRVLPVEEKSRPHIVTEYLKGMDFGIAKAAGVRRLTFTGLSSALGTPDYMAPKQIKGKRGDARTDLYSLGAMLYEMRTGQPPFEGTNPYIIMNARLVSEPVAPRKHNPDIPPAVEEIVLHALEQQPYNRYLSAAAMRAELLAPRQVQVTGRCERLRAPVA
jgi:serine/threonine-protein kinase